MVSTSGLRAPPGSWAPPPCGLATAPAVPAGRSPGGCARCSFAPGRSASRRREERTVRVALRPSEERRERGDDDGQRQAREGPYRGRSLGAVAEQLPRELDREQPPVA